MLWYTAVHEVIGHTIFLVGYARKFLNIVTVFLLGRNKNLNIVVSLLSEVIKLLKFSPQVKVQLPI